MTSHCKHEWHRRSDVLREVFVSSRERTLHDFFVCARCLKIQEVVPEAAAESGRQAA